MNYATLIEKYAARHKLYPATVYGVCMAESSMDPKATRYEPDYRWLYQPEAYDFISEIHWQKTSLGLMQVMGAVLREYGYKPSLQSILSSPSNQLDYGCRHLSAKIRKYGAINGIAAYNTGSPRWGNGKLVNQEYVDKVLRHAKDFPAYAK